MINLIPAPQKCNVMEGQFKITPRTKLLYTKSTPRARKIANTFAEFLAPVFGRKLKVEATSKAEPVEQAIVLTLAGSMKRLGDEGYRLVILPEHILIRAAKPAGLFYGLQSLRQLLPAVIETRREALQHDITVQCAKIEDIPRFKWRGMHYDPCRHFLGLGHVLEYIDSLAMLKFNVLHFHLTEDQGWRIEIKKYPKLVEIGAWRNGTKNLYWKSTGDRKKHGGFYTQDYIQMIIKYAADRFITVVPEIEMPGHAQAAIAAYPQFSCTGGPHKVWTRWGVSKEVFCAGREDVFKFLQDVLEEVIELFPSKYIHIGGDECPKDRWRACPKCQKRVRDEKLTDEHELQSYFIRRIEKFINSKGRKMIGWDEILEGGLAPNAAVMSWRGYDGGWKAAAQGHNVVMTPHEYTYFNNRPFEDTKSGHPAILSLRKAYSFDPETGFKPAWKKYILGGQGAMWSEYLNNREEFNLHLFPRVAAISEVLWSPKKMHNFKNFCKRASILIKRLR